MQTVLQDLRYGLRMLAKNTGFTSVAVLTLAVAIGANTAIFSVIDTLLLRLPRFQHLDRLVYLIDKNPKVPAEVEVRPSPGNFLDWREQARSFDYMAAWRNWYFTLSEPQSGQTPSESVRGVRVSPVFFSMLGAKTPLGRVFRREEERPGHDQVVVLSDGLWKRRFGADPTIIGRKLLIDGRPFSVIGILPSDFQFYQSDFDAWMPLSVNSAFHDRGDHSVMVFARLAPDASIAQAQAEMEAVGRRLGEVHPDTNAGWGVRVMPLFPNREVRDVRPALLLPLAAAGFDLLIASANVANLLLARAVSRQREITIRAAIGATRGRLIRQMLTESILLASMGGTGGLLLAPVGVRMLIPLLPHAGTNRTIGGFRAVVPSMRLWPAASGRTRIRLANTSAPVSKTDIPWAVDVPTRWLTIVGVAGDIREIRLDGEPEPELYVSYRQFPSSFMFLRVRTDIPPEGLANAVENEIRTIDLDQAVSNVQTMDDAISNAVPRFNVQLLTAFAALALLLSAAGVYGVTSYAVGMRTREIGVRMALGARRVDVLAMVVREGCALAVIGVVAGLVGAFWITRTMTTLLYGVAPTDAIAFTSAAVVVFAVAVVACYLPARQATKVDAIVVLRHE